MATVTKTIGTTSRDYATFTLWEADLDDDTPYDAADDAVGDVYDDTKFDEDFDLFEGTGLPLASVTLSGATGERHDGTMGTGAGQSASTNQRWDIHPVASGVPYVLSFLEWDNNSFKLSTEFIECNSGDITISNWVMANADDTTSFGYGIEVRGASFDFRIMNNIIYDIAAGGTHDANGIKFLGIPTVNVYFSNNTIHNIRNGGTDTAVGLRITTDDAQTFVQNNLITDAEDACFEPSSFSNATASHNAASDTTASGTGSIDDITTSDQYVSTTGGSEDLHLKTGSDAIGAGTDLGTTPTGIQFDIENRDRDTEGDTWDIGADQSVSGDIEGSILVDADTFNDGLVRPTNLFSSLLTDADTFNDGDIARKACDQEGFRWRNDDGNEAAATFRQAQDVDETVAAEITLRLRILVDGLDDPDAESYQLEYKETGDADTEFRKVPV